MTAKDLNQIETIVIVMLENRSFDHQLGYLAVKSIDHTQTKQKKDAPGS